MQLPGAQPAQGVGTTVPSTAGMGLNNNSNPPLLAVGPPGRPGAWATVGWPNFANAVNPAFWRDAAVAKNKLANLPASLANMFGAASQGQPTNSADLVGAGDTSLRPGPSLLPQARGVAVPPNNVTAATAAPNAGGMGSSGIGGDWRYPLTNASMASKPYGPNLPPGGMPPGRAKTMGPTASTSTPSGAGTPTGSPAATPRPALSNSGFGLYQSQVPGMGVGPLSRNPIYTTRNFFGGGQQPVQQSAAANPANLPAPNAQPVSGTLANNGMSNAPWNWGPLQKGMNWPGSSGPSWRDWIAAHSGYQ